MIAHGDEATTLDAAVAAGEPSVDAPSDQEVSAEAESQATQAMS